MKKKFVGFIQLILVFNILSCNSDKKAKIVPVETVNLSGTYEDLYECKLSDIATRVDYIKLETNFKSVISNISHPRFDVLFSENQILINDSNKELLLFKKTGEFLRKIGHIGKGPGEYVKIGDFTMLPEKELIIINEQHLRKAFVYNFDGVFLREFPLEFLPNSVFGFNGQLMFGNSVFNRRISEYYTFTTLNTEGKELRKLLYKETEKETNGINTYFGGFHKITYTLNDTLNYWEKNGFSKKDTVWSITKNLESFPKYVIDLGGEKIPLERMKQKKRLSLEDFYQWTQLMKFLESDKYMFYDILNKKDYVRIYTEKSLMTSKRLDGIKEPNGFVDGKFKNDIDGGLYFWPQGKVSDNKVFTLVYGYEIKDYIEKQGENFIAKDSKGREKLLDIAKNAKVTDNPILMVVTLKN